jgi:dTMP kinase
MGCDWEEGAYNRPPWPGSLAVACLFEYNLDNSGDCKPRGARLSLFITFEGPEGGGKTSQLRFLAAHLREEGCQVLTAREPGGTAIGDRVRAVLLDPVHTEMHPTTEFLLFSASRAQLVAQVIRPHLAQGGVVLCDRYGDASLAYQGYGYGQDLAVVTTITRFATGGLIPDLTFCLDVPVEIGLRRKSGGSGDAWNRMEQKEIAYHERVRAAYLAMAAQEPGRWVVIDATADLRTVQAAIRERVRRELVARGMLAPRREAGASSLKAQRGER